ncbi:hypothetical protein G3A_09800 [Bacillus sp. 17376]|nr:hypothetical protein G3A_09800 [Bacillus sp. 17376]
MKVSGFIGNMDVVSKTFAVMVKVFFYVFQAFTRMVRVFSFGHAKGY